MTILSIPVPTHSVKGWRNIASTFPFCVQQNSNLDTPSHNEAGTDINGYTWESEDEDVPPTTTAAVDKQSFRIMHTQCPSDLSSRDSLLSLDGNRGTGSGDGAKAHRVVVAVSSSLGDILEDWGWILQQWKSSGNSDNAALSAVAWDRTLALIKRAQEDEDTAPPFSGGDTCVFQPATDSGNGDNNSNNTGRVGGNDAPLPAQRINVNNNNAKITTTGGKRNGGENVTTDNNGNNNNSDKHSGGTTTINEEAQFYDFYDTALLRLYDLWLWETPQLTALMLLSLWSRPILHGWSAVLAIGLFVAMPIGPSQQQRRKQWSDKSQATCVSDARKKCESDKQKLATLHSFTKQVSIQTVKIAAAVAVIAAGLSCTFAHQSFDMFVLGLTTLLVLGSGVQQLILMRTSQKQQQSVTPAVTPSSRVTCPLVVEDLCSSQPQQASTTRGEAPSDVPPLSSAFRHLRRTESTGAMVESATRGGGPPPLYESGTPSASSTTRHNQFRYTLPALTDKETTIEAQLTNYGAPFSIILLKPLREWNQMNASWVTRWERGGLRYEEHYGSSSSINIRMTARIPHANVGTLQSILLDDIDCLDAKSTWAYQYNPLLTQRCLVKRLGYNTMITLTRYRSMVYGVPPLELLHYVSPAILLDEEQQEALQLRRPFSAAQTPTTNSPSDNNNNNSKTRKPLMAFVQCGIPCPAELHSTPPCQPPHERGATEYFFTIGMEEADGSLTVGVYQSLRPEGIVPEEWALVYKAATARKAFKLTELLRQEGPKENRVAVYRNERAFQPIVDRQAVSEGEPKQMNLAAMSASRRAAALSRDEANLGSAFLTSELKVADTTPRRLRRQLEGSSTALPCSPGAAHCRTLSLSHDINALTSTFPRLVEKFMKELLACSAWKSDGENDGVRYHSATTALSSRKATRTDVFIPKASIAMMCNLLMIDSLAAEYDRSIKDRVTITPSILQKLLVDSVSNNNNNNNNNNSKGTTIDFARESYHGCALRYTQYRSSMWGSASRDTVTRVAEPYYMTVSDVTAFLTSCNVADNFNMFNTVSPTSRLFVLCGEDAGDALPSFKGYQRQRIPLFGTMCWEEGDGIRVVFCECTAPAGGGILSAATASARSVQDQVKMTRNVKGLVEHYLQDVQTD